MKKTLYDVIQVSPMAEQAVIEAACHRLIQKFQAEASADAQNQIKFIRHAYEILIDPAQRAFYDANLKKQEYEHARVGTQLPAFNAQYQSEFVSSTSSWWDSPKVTLIIIAIIVLVGFSLFTRHSAEKNKIEIVNTIEATKREANELNAANQAVLVNGVVETQSKYVDAAQQQDEKRRMDMQLRADAERRALELRNMEQEARLEMQRKQQADREAATKKRDEDNRVDRERRYYVCMNAAIDRYGTSQAQSMCRR